MRSKFIFMLLLALTSIDVYAQDTIRVDPAIRFQTIEGWGHGGGILGHTGGARSMLDSSVADPVNYQMLDYLVDDLGLTGSRLWEVGPRTDGTGMDNGDCDSIDWSKFQSGTLLATDADYLLYFSHRVLDEGFQPSFYSSPGYPTHATDQKPWVMYHPGERAQQIWASALYLKNRYGIITNYAVIYNEPSGNLTSGLLADDIKALGPRLAALGLKTKSQFAEAVAPQNDWGFITPVQNDPDLWQYVGRLSYHNYGTADPYRSYIRDFALSRGIATAQTEMGNPTFDDLYSDLTLGGVSYWEVGFSSSNTLVPNAGLTSFTPSSTYFRLRQVMHYVRPGAVRIESTSNDSLLHLLSFLRNGAVTTIIENRSPSSKTVTLTGLPSGEYGLSEARPGTGSFQELGIHKVEAGGTLSINVNGGSGVTTLYPYRGPNLPPTIMTWGSNPGYLLAPATTAKLSVTANDPERDSLTYQWTVAKHPAGASPVIDSPNSASTSVSGLALPGTYLFNVEVRDGTNISSKEVYLIAYAENPPPVLGGAGFRIATPYGLVFTLPGDTTHANIELPTSSVTLQVGISDLANSNFTGRGTWSLVRQPAGADVTIDKTTYIYVSIRAVVTGMTVPGDYVFKVDVTNPGHPNLTAQVICTVHPPSSAPLITSITPSPASLTLPASTTRLTAETADPEDDLLRHWWVVKSVPAGARPAFDHQGLPVTDVSGLTVPGTYTFTLRAFDDLHMTARDVRVTVADAVTGVGNDPAGKRGVVIYPNPASEDLHVQLLDDHHGISDLELLNMLGQVVAEQQVRGADMGIITIPVGPLPAGAYFLTVKSRDGIAVETILKR
jgi:hypothetical protein